MPTPARTVQLRSVQDVITAYQNWDVARFAIWNGKQLLFAYDNEDPNTDEGVQLLEQWLTIIQRGGSAGIYTLAIYKDPVKSITNATPYNGSVNFQLAEYSYGNNNAGGGMLSGVSDPGYKALADEIKAMRLEINKLQQEADEDNDDDSNGNMIGQISELLKNPVIAGLLASILPKAKQTTMQTIPPQSGNVSRIAGATSNEENKRIAEALAKLRASVPDLPALLEQLSKLAQTQPQQFNFYMSTLMNMQL